MFESDEFSLDRRGLTFGLLGSLTATAGWAQAVTPTSLMTACHDTTRFSNARFVATLTQQNRTGVIKKRDLSGVVKLINDGASSARRIRFSSPSDMRGVATLSIEQRNKADDLWIYLPTFRRVRRLVSANRADPWVGSDFSLGDISGHKVSDWNHTTAVTEAVSGFDAWRIQSTPALPVVATDTGYAKRVSWLRKSDAALLKADFYDLSGALSKTLIAEEFRVLDANAKKIQPMRMTMRTFRQSSISILQFTSFTIQGPVAAGELTPAALAT